MSNEKMTRDQQREAARTKAKAMREAQKKNDGRRKMILISAVGAAVASLLGLVAWAVFGAATNPTGAANVPVNAIVDGGISIKSDLHVATASKEIDNSIPKIVLYEDPQCPICKRFEEPIMPAMLELVKAGKYSLEIHAISFLDGSSANEYSSRASSAIYCVADFAPAKFTDFHKAIFDGQPEENTPGPSSDDLAKLASGVGITDASAIDCIKADKYATWAKNKGRDIWLGTVPGSQITFGGTPFVMVNGQQYVAKTSNPADFLLWLQTVAPVIEK